MRTFEAVTVRPIATTTSNQGGIARRLLPIGLRVTAERVTEPAEIRAAQTGVVRQVPERFRINYQDPALPAITWGGYCPGSSLILGDELATTNEGTPRP